MTTSGAVKNKIMQNKKLAAKLHKPFFRKFEKWKVHSSFVDKTWCTDLADMQLLRKFNSFFVVLLLFIVNFLGLFPWNLKEYY